MAIEITLILLFSAFVHALWNSMIKGASDGVAMATWIYAGGGVLLGPMLLFLPPLPAQGWLLVGGHFILHMIYKVCLLRMYRLGDFSQVFPIARGSAPALVTLLAIPMIGEFPSTTAAIGVAVVCLGLLIFALEPGALAKAGSVPILLALGAGMVVSLYSVIDAIGVRIEGAGLSFFITLYLCDGLGMVALGLFWRGRDLWPLLRPCWRTGMAASCLSMLHFGIALWVVSFNPVGVASAVRETSIVMAALIGTFFFGEGFGRRRFVGSIVILAGIVLINQ